MNHRYIDENSVAERYLQRTLDPAELEEFEAHVVDCAECADRLLLAQVFLERNAAIASSSAPWPKRAEFAARLRPYQLLLAAMIAAMLLVAIPTVYFLWELARLSGRR